MKYVLPALAAIVTATAVFAHGGVTDPVVLARMEAMKRIGGNVKVIGDMAKGEAAFDADAVQTALNAIQAEAAEIPAYFEQQILVDGSEALPAIWQNWDDFVAKSSDLEVAAGSLNVSSADDLGAALQQIGGACAGCHKSYRE